MIPENIFQALSRGEIISILLFIIMLGISIGMVKAESGQTLIHLLDGITESLFRMMDWLLTLLPLGLLSIFAQTMSQFGSETFLTLGKVILVLLLVTNESWLSMLS